eukprot:TRINITY_DN4233_c0_g2_i2.p4 TRINITY_DN4233_c0_g2~~TRINITY_DN4233_c0_g2_i2.p4  ORF type:complete len:135 (+),score=39.60 TRINITY_DN4233_c0_g2_i2:1641-2045(+)
MPRIRELLAEHAQCADFLMVYLEEAHASDEWPIYQLEQDIPQHKTLPERLGVANKFLQDFCQECPLQLVVDSIDNQFNQVFASWPFRFWVLEKEVGGGVRVGFKAMPEESAYDPEHLNQYLKGRSHCTAAGASK